jgi:hypothetical protein
MSRGPPRAATNPAVRAPNLSTQQLALDVRHAKVALVREEGAATPAALCARLSGLGYPAMCVAASRGGGSAGAAKSAQCFKSLRHVFIVVRPERVRHADRGDASIRREGAVVHEELIVDAAFKEVRTAGGHFFLWPPPVWRMHHAVDAANCVHYL